MSEMVERVARAICAAAHIPAQGGWSDDEIASFTDEYWQGYTEEARAAISAMREPTKEMWRAGSWDNGYVTDGAWQAMIDAALTEEK